jgi:hypothetical protein
LPISASKAFSDHFMLFRREDVKLIIKLSINKHKLTMSKIRIALIEDHDLTRVGIRTALLQKKEFEFVGEAANAAEGREMTTLVIY